MSAAKSPSNSLTPIRLGLLPLALLACLACDTGPADGVADGGDTAIGDSDEFDPADEAGTPDEGDGSAPDGGDAPVGELSPERDTAESPAESWLLSDSDRPVRVVHPAPGSVRPSPLLILLHGYGAGGQLQDSYLGVSAEAAARGWVVLLPDGTRDASGNRFWNASPSWCCDFFDATPDDTGWLGGVLDAAFAALDVDPSRVALFGHSNGAYMGHRLACVDAERVRALVAIAGGLPQRATACEPTRPVSVLQIHGTYDSVVLYYGRPGLYPSSPVVASRWASYNGCAGDGPTDEERRRRYDGAVWGEQTRVTRYPACGTGADVQLWTLETSGHTPLFVAPFMADVFDWLEAQVP